MSNDSMTRRKFLTAAFVVAFPGLLHREAGSEVFALPVHAWRALVFAATTTRRFFAICQDISAGSAAVMARFISDCPEDVSFYVNLYFGIHEPTPPLDTGQVWFSNPRRLERLCVFLQRGGCAVEERDGWTTLTRRK